MVVIEDWEKEAAVRHQLSSTSLQPQLVEPGRPNQGVDRGQWIVELYPVLPAGRTWPPPPFLTFFLSVRLMKAGLELYIKLRLNGQ